VVVTVDCEAVVEGFGSLDRWQRVLIPVSYLPLLAYLRGREAVGQMQCISKICRSVVRDYGDVCRLLGYI
jgi:hypothetical protein